MCGCKCRCRLSQFACDASATHLTRVIFLHFYRTPYDRETIFGIVLFYFQQLTLYVAFTGVLCFYPAFFACVGIYLERFCDQLVCIFHQIDDSTEHKIANRRSDENDQIDNLMRIVINYQTKLSR